MSQTIRIGNHAMTSTQILELLAGYQMLPQLWRELIVDAAIAPIELTPAEQKLAIEQFHELHQLNTPTALHAWAEHYGMSLEQLEERAKRQLKIEKFKIITWGARLESYFLTHKSKLDKVIYSLLRTPNPEVAQELYFRIRGGEQEFALLAREYSTGPEAQTGGLIGPVELSTPHPELTKLLSISQPGQLCPPTRLGEWFVIVRLEKFIPAVLDETMRQQLLDNLFETWLQEELKQLHIQRRQNPQKELVAV